MGTRRPPCTKSIGHFSLVRAGNRINVNAIQRILKKSGVTGKWISDHPFVNHEEISYFTLPTCPYHPQQHRPIDIIKLR